MARRPLLALDRRAVVAGALAAVGVVVLGLVDLPQARGGVSAPAPAPAPAPVPAPGTGVVAYGGLTLALPAGWQVVELDQAPQTCVRFDRPTIFVGTPGDQAGCPAGGAADAPGVLVEPRAGRTTAVPSWATTAGADDGTDAGAPLPAPSFVGGDAVVVVPAADMIITAHAGPADEAVVAEMIMSTQVVAPARGTDGPAPGAAAGDTGTTGGSAARVVVPGSYAGLGFDACTAPSAAAMNAWLASPFRAVGVYIGGVTRACAQQHLDSAWVQARVASGWTLIPTFVGLQAPCTGYAHRMSYDTATARSQGVAEAGDAVVRARSLDIGPGSAVYSDIEGYDTGVSGCSAAVRAYVDGWTDRLHQLGYLAGVYSSAASGARDLAATYGSPTWTSPDHIWFAWWNGRADTDGGQYVPDSAWPDRQRIHQYRGDHAETHGGVKITIDSNALDVGEGSTPPPRCDQALDFPSYPLVKQGSTGTRVAAAQCLLERLGHDPGAVDGQFGASTTRAVRGFQSSVGLGVDGQVGRATWTALLSAGSTPVLHQGASGEDVRRLQRALTAALGRTVGIDGQFGSGTTRAVRDYQSSRGLGVDGVVGAATWSSLQRGR